MLDFHMIQRFINRLMWVILIYSQFESRLTGLICCLEFHSYLPWFGKVFELSEIFDFDPYKDASHVLAFARTSQHSLIFCRQNELDVTQKHFF